MIQFLFLSMEIKMLKGAVLSIICFFAVGSFAAPVCPDALPTNNPGFCDSFKIAAKCHCKKSGLPTGMCNDTELLYRRLIAAWGSLENICASQKYTSKQECVDDWNCYRLGGRNSKGQLCSSTGHSCNSKK
jgi:hypothetical protein